MAGTIKIEDCLEYDFEFPQPKYHFGQMLEDHKRDVGFVVGMGLGLEWHYTLFYVVADFPGRSIPESKLAIAAITTDNVEVG